MKIVSIDPGYDRMGVAILDGTRSKSSLLYSDCLTTNPKDDFANRLFFLGQELETIIQKYEPDTLAMEKLYFENNQRTAMHVAETRGMLIYLAKLHSLELLEYTPLQIKMAVAGHGGASKAQVMKMIPLLIKMDNKKRRDDEYDAIGVGLTALACK